jgi:transposase
MGKHYKPWTPTQSYLLPPSPMDWLPEGHLVYFLLDVVGQLDLRELKERQEGKDPRGTRAYHPAMMTALLLYGYSVGVYSSRRIERATYEDVAFRVLCGGQHPDHTRISEFRRKNLGALRRLFVQVLRLCQEAGLVKLGHVALDGTKMQASASKHKAMSYERMKRSEAALLEEIEALLRQAEQHDAQEDALHGKDRRGDELPEELSRRQSRLERIREAKAKLEAEAAAAKARERLEQAQEARQKAEEAEEQERRAAQGRVEAAQRRAEEAVTLARHKAEQAGEPEPQLEPRSQSELPSHQVQADKDGNPLPGAQRNFTDPDSRIMKRASEFVQGYNCQAAVDGEHQIIVAEALTNQSPDQQHLVPLLEQVQHNCGALPDVLSADSGYWSEHNASACSERGVDPHIATEKLKHNEKPASPRGRIPRSLDARGRMQRKLRTKLGRALYALRKQIVEPVFGQIKDARGFRRFLLRGIEKVRAEWSLLCTTHNLLKLYRARAA